VGYCSIQDIRNIIAQTLTSATASDQADLDKFPPGFNLLRIGDVGRSFDKNLLPQDVIESYIQIADATIDAKFSQLYLTPFSEIVDLEAKLFSPVGTNPSSSSSSSSNEDVNYTVVLDKVCPINPGDVIILIQNGVEERAVVSAIIDGTSFTVDGEYFQNYYPTNTRVVRVSYPKPIRYISARLAAANIYDKYFTAEASPNTSEFGKYLRKIAYNDMNDILNGRTKLHGQQRIGRTFYNPNIVEQYDLPKGQDGAKDMGDINV